MLCLGAPRQWSAAPGVRLHWRYATCQTLFLSHHVDTVVPTHTTPQHSAGEAARAPRRPPWKAEHTTQDVSDHRDTDTPKVAVRTSVLLAPRSGSPCLPGTGGARDYRRFGPHPGFLRVGFAWCVRCRLRSHRRLIRATCASGVLCKRVSTRVSTGGGFLSACHTRLSQVRIRWRAALNTCAPRAP